MNRKELLYLLDKKKNVHFVGIGGVSMSALAEILVRRGYTVTGSDIGTGEVLGRLRASGVIIYGAHDPSNITDKTEIVVRTAAVHDDNCEIIRARELGLPVVERALLLGAIMEGYGYPVSVAGTHGKTTTTSMISEILLDAGLDPSCLVGGQMAHIGGNLRIGASEYIVCEACEYYDSFLSMTQKVAVVLNIDADHLDYFKNIENIKKSFGEFITQTGSDGICVVCRDNANAMEVASRCLPKIVTFGFDERADFSVRNAVMHGMGSSFDIYRDGEPFASIELSVPGRHNISNAAAACAAACALGVDAENIAKGLARFTGTKRRFEIKGKFNGAVVADDYAHHPGEIRATLSAARELGYKRIICAFQPHTYSRTEALFDEFVEALALADMTLLAEIYAAREKNVNGTSSRAIADRIEGAAYFADFASLEEFLRKEAREGDLVITMGAGDIYKVAEALIEK